MDEGILRLREGSVPGSQANGVPAPSTDECLSTTPAGPSTWQSTHPQPASTTWTWTPHRRAEAKNLTHEIRDPRRKSIALS